MNRSSGEGDGMGDVVRILVADDHPLTRDGIKAALALDADLEVVAEASDGQEAVDLAEEVKPDVVLMDVHMPVLGGIRATQTISRTVPTARVVMLTVEEPQARGGEAIQAGAPAGGSGRCPWPPGARGSSPPPSPASSSRRSASSPGASRASPPSRPGK